MIRKIAASPAFFVCAALLGQSLPAEVSYLPNQGQWNDPSAYRAEVTGGVIWLEDAGWTALERLASETDNGASTDRHDASARQHIAWRGRWTEPAAETWSVEDLSDRRYNYYLGNDPTTWAEGLQGAGRVYQRSVWSGVDVRWSGSPSGRAKFDFMVAPGGDPSRIGWVIEGPEPRLLADGRIEIGTSYLEQPWAYQLIDGRLIDVACAYLIRRGEITLELGEYAAGHPLVIDPEITFSTYIGSTADNFGTTASNGPGGRLIAGAAVFDVGYPTTAGAIENSFIGGVCDIAFSVFSEDGANLEYSTYLGGNQADIPHSLAYDEASNAVVLMGTTGSTNFPTSAGSYQSTLELGAGVTVNIYGPTLQPNGLDLFVVKFDITNWIMDRSTYVGGSGADGLNMAGGLKANFGDDYRGQVDIAPDGTVWIATTSTSADLPMPGGSTNSGGQDGLILGLSSDLSQLDYGAFFGGSNDDAAYSVEENGGLIYVGGGTKSADLSLPPGAVQTSNAGGPTDGWVAVFSTTGGLLSPEFATYHGGSNYDQVYFVQTDADGLVYGFGQAREGLPVVGDVYSNPGSGQFITCWTPDLSEILWQTSIGTGNGSIDISPTAFLVSDCQQLYISGWGGSSNNNSGSAQVSGSTTFGLPTTDDAYQSSTDGSDFYLAVLAPEATDLVYGSFLGGDFSSEHVDGGSSRFDINGTVYQAVCAGCGSFDDFPSTPGAWSSNNPSLNCNLGVFKFELGTLNANADLADPDAYCTGDEIEFVNNTGGSAAFLWDFGDATFSEEFSPSHLYGIPGEYTVELIATDTTGCLEPDTAFVEVLVGPDANPQIEPVEPLCLGSEQQLQGSGNGNLTWWPPLGLSATNVPDPIADPVNTTTYTLTDIAICGTATAEVVIEVVNLTSEAPGDAQICLGDEIELAITSETPESGSPPDPSWNYTWTPAAGLDNPADAAPLASPTATTNYTVLVETPEGCFREHELTIAVVPAAPGDSIYPDVSLCFGQSSLLSAAPGSTWQWAPQNSLTTPGAQSTFAAPTTTTTYAITITNICGPGVDSVTVEVLVPEAHVSDGGLTCPGEPFEVAAWGAGGSSGTGGAGNLFQWTPGAMVESPGLAATTVYPLTTQTFTAYVTDSDGCTASASLTVTVLPPPYVNAGPDLQQVWLEPTFLLGDIGTTVDSIWWTPAEGLSCDTCLYPEIINGSGGVYTLHVQDLAGCRAADEVRVNFFYPLYVPSAFTPGNDGINDGFRPVGAGLSDYPPGAPDRGYRFEIWNRWGDLIWFTHDPAAYWQGEFSSGEHYVQTDVYTWRIFFPTHKGRESRQGHVTVLR